MRQFSYKIKDQIGIHARPAGLLVNKAKEHLSVITITKGDKTVSATKLMAVMTLGVKCGDEILVTIDGIDEDDAYEALKSFFESNL